MRKLLVFLVFATGCAMHARYRSLPQHEKDVLWRCQQHVLLTQCNRKRYIVRCYGGYCNGDYKPDTTSNVMCMREMLLRPYLMAINPQKKRFIIRRLGCR